MEEGNRDLEEFLREYSGDCLTNFLFGEKYIISINNSGNVYNGKKWSMFCIYFITEKELIYTYK